MTNLEWYLWKIVTFQGNETLFALNNQNGEIYIKEPLDREVSDYYELIIKANNPIQHSLTDTVIVTVFVLDINDNKPVFDQPYYNAVIFENILPSNNTPLICVNATDADSERNAVIRSAIIYFTIN